RSGAAPARFPRVPGERCSAGACGSSRTGDALPAGASRRGDNRRGPRRPALDRSRRSGKPAACTESGDGLAVAAGSPGPDRAHSRFIDGGMKVATEHIKKMVLAYSGGLDTSVMLRWLKDRYQCEIVAYCADVGQADETEGLEERALKTGA